MVCPHPFQRVLCAVTLSLLALGASDFHQDAWARHPQSYEVANTLGIVSVHVNPDGTGLSIEANRPFTGNETRNLSVLRLPSPYRLVVDIPNARLASGQTLFPTGRNGIDHVELTETKGTFYNAVRAIVYVNDAATLSKLASSFEGNALKLEGLSPIAAAPAVRTPMVPQAGMTYRRPLTAVQPLPPVTTPNPQRNPGQNSGGFVTLTKPPVPVQNTEPARTVADNPQGVLSSPILPGTNLINEVYFRDNRLYIKGNDGAELHVKNRFTLTAPSRLVMDIEDSVLANRALMTPIAGPSDDVRQIRVGQFDENTVRIVIEAANPDQFDASYPGSDRSLLTINPYGDTSITRLSANTKLGQVESIDLKREGSNTILRLSASAPIVHRFMKQNDRVSLELLNEAARPTAIGFDASQYPEINKMRMDPLADGQPNSRLSITLANPDVRVVPTLSDDGKVLELMMTGGASGQSYGAANDLSNLISMGAAGKAPFPARIVVDAGHGGKDMGANRNGIMEKDLNLSLALMVRDALVAKGFKVYMTRSEDVFLPLPQISAITNQIHPDLFISIHHNASVNSALNGIETYYYTPQSVALARRVHAREINNVAAKDGGVKRAMFYVIHHTDVPAILCEVGYVSNPNELDDLQSTERKSKTARSIADGVVDYLKTRISAKAR